MTFEELLIACGRGELPEVIDAKDGNIGAISVIKNDHSFKGVAVRYGKIPYNIRYYANDQGDKRKRHMGDLTLRNK